MWDKIFEHLHTDAYEKMDSLQSITSVIDMEKLKRGNESMSKYTPTDLPTMTGNEIEAVAYLHKTYMDKKKPNPSFSELPEGVTREEAFKEWYRLYEITKANAITFVRDNLVTQVEYLNTKEAIRNDKDMEASEKGHLYREARETRDSKLIW